MMKANFTGLQGLGVDGRKQNTHAEWAKAPDLSAATLRACKKNNLMMVRYADANSALRFNQTVKLFPYNALAMGTSKNFAHPNDNGKFLVETLLGGWGPMNVGF